MSGLIWIQAVCKGYQQTTPPSKVLRNYLMHMFSAQIPDFVLILFITADSGRASHAVDFLVWL